MTNGALLDTSFFIRLNNETDALHSNATNYLRFLIQNNFQLYLSTISIAEYCVIGEFDELPLKYLNIIFLDTEHAKIAGKLAKIIFENKDKLRLKERNIIANDTKLFAQANYIKEIKYYITSDTESGKMYALLKDKIDIDFDFIDLSLPPSLTIKTV